MNRRRFIKRVGTASSVLTFGSINLWLPKTAVADEQGAPQSPPTTPFVQDLPIPPDPIPTPPFATPDCAGIVNASAKFFHLVEEERFVQFHPQLPPTPIWGYRDFNQPVFPFVPGPTFRARMNQPMIVRVTNALPLNHQGFGNPRTTVHQHGGHQESRSDGFPTLDFGPGEFYDYCYPMLDHGFSTPEPQPGERPATNWYHDHLLDFTGPNVYRGLAGFYLVYDELDTGDENTGLKLPSGPFEIPLLIQDKRFFPDGRLFFDTFNHDGFIGDKFVVNGAIQPRLRVKRRKYRFRFLNGSNARIYEMYLTNSANKTFPFDWIGNDGGLFSRPLRAQQKFQIAPAERADIVIDFRQFAPGQEIFIENRLEMKDGRKPNNLLIPGIRILKFIVGADAPDPSLVPDVLRPFPPVTPTEIAAAVRRTFIFERTNGAWAINGQFFNPASPMFVSLRGQPEIWKLINKSGGWWHPIHVHLDFMRVLSRNGQLPPPQERDGIAKKDTILLRDNDVVEVFFKFQDFTGPYVTHCHNLEHEDLAMMFRFDVV